MYTFKIEFQFGYLGMAEIATMSSMESHFVHLDYRKIQKSI